MNTALKITGFAAALAGAFGATYAVGSSLAPISTGTEPAAHADHGGGAAAGAGGPQVTGPGDPPAGGLQISESGYALDLRTPRVEAERRTELRFGILDASGRKTTAYKRVHGKELHLILASRDLSVYRHLHPTRTDDGTWSTPVDLPKAGDYRIFADFTPAAMGGKNLTLGADLAVSGIYKPVEFPDTSRTASVDGYTVTVNGDLRPGEARKLDLKITKNGRPVTNLQPYLGAYGHLVALRSGDLAYLHVHPNDEADDDTTKPGPVVSFTATAPSSGAYRLFLDFKHGGKVRTAAFTVPADAAAEGSRGTGPSEDDEMGDHQH
ncbi:hypothetical protein [Streptomyces sp. V1I1]|uniref:hypothetical protein n=1 Tax=Streptomyces sp. V1I1 TaxID=3042272 RepID=UPI0027878BA2|nr:hypothetical protein [Streptomyces sp. V1I1]MDQ0939287.1 hypothetical protein [Streptomyces sp. V1I1]